MVHLTLLLSQVTHTTYHYDWINQRTLAQEFTGEILNREDRCPWHALHSLRAASSEAPGLVRSGAEPPRCRGFAERLRPIISPVAGGLNNRFARAPPLLPVLLVVAEVIDSCEVPGFVEWVGLPLLAKLSLFPANGAEKPRSTPRETGLVTVCAKQLRPDRKRSA